LVGGLREESLCFCTYLACLPRIDLYFKFASSAQENEAKAKAQEDEQQQAENRFLELQRKAKEQMEKYVLILCIRKLYVVVNVKE